MRFIKDVVKNLTGPVLFLVAFFLFGSIMYGHIDIKIANRNSEVVYTYHKVQLDSIEVVTELAYGEATTTVLLNGRKAGIQVVEISPEDNDKPGEAQQYLVDIAVKWFDYLIVKTGRGIYRIKIDSNFVPEPAPTAPRVKEQIA